MEFQRLVRAAKRSFLGLYIATLCGNIIVHGEVAFDVERF